jgi:protein associated with RNAse G/E
MAVSVKIREDAAEKVAELKRYLRSMGYSTSLTDILSKSVEFAFEHLTEFTKIFEQRQDPLWEWAGKPIRGPKVRAADEVDRAVYDLR